jgi:hypothetical protein
MRFRGLVYSKAASITRITVSTMIATSDALSNLASHIGKIVDLSKSTPNTPVRLKAPQNKAPTATLGQPDVQAILLDNLLVEAPKQMKVFDPQKPDGIGELEYNGINKPVNSDWAVIQGWITNKLFLDGIPMQYLIVDPSHLPMEKMRYFYIDPNWLDCLIDGALSVCNHADRGGKVPSEVTRHVGC